MTLSTSDLRELLSIDRELTNLRVQIKLLRDYLSGKAGFDTDQPRVSAGTPEGGQWVGVGAGGEARPLQDSRQNKVPRSPQYAATRRISPAREAECLVLFQRDTFHCTIVGLASCHRQAAERYGACLSGKPLPPLSY